MKKTKNNFLLLQKPKALFFVIAVSIIFTVFASVIFTGCNSTTTAKAEETKTSETQAQKETAAETTAAETTAASAENAVSFEGKTLVISGSDTMLQVSNAWADAFMSKFSGEITVNGGGSGVGIADLINKANDLANASRQMKQEEIDQAKANGVEPEEHTVLYDGISIILSKNLDIKELTIEQLSKIYTGKAKNWKEFGGPDAKIVAISRDSSSGTYEYFLERVVQLNKKVKDNDFGENILRLPSNSDIAQQVANNDNCIGYIGLGYLQSALGTVNVLAVKADDGSAAVLPDVDTVKDKSYPIARGLYIYSNKNNFSDFAKAYIDFVLSDEGQAIGAEVGFVPIK